MIPVEISSCGYVRVCETRATSAPRTPHANRSWFGERLEEPVKKATNACA